MSKQSFGFWLVEQHWGFSPLFPVNTYRASKDHQDEPGRLWAEEEKVWANPKGALRSLDESRGEPWWELAFQISTFLSHHDQCIQETLSLWFQECAWEIDLNKRFSSRTPLSCDVHPCNSRAVFSTLSVGDTALPLSSSLEIDLFTHVCRRNKGALPASSAETKPSQVLT